MLLVAEDFCRLDLAKHLSARKQATEEKCWIENRFERQKTSYWKKTTGGKSYWEKGLSTRRQTTVAKKLLEQK